VIGSGEKPKPTTSFFPKTPVPGGK